MISDDEKPEWFRLTEGDKVPPQKKTSRGLRAFAVTLPLLVLGTGFVLAQSQSDPGVAANQPTSLASASNPTSAAPIVPTTSAAPIAASIQRPSGESEGNDD